MAATNTIQVEQEILIRHLKEGSETAYEILFKDYYLRLVMYAYRFVGDVELSKELVQDLFVTLFEKRESLHIQSSLASYLYKAVHNRSLNYLQAQKSKMNYTKHILSNAETLDISIEQEMGRTELESALLEAIGALPERCRLIFKLNRFDGLSNSEIAQKLALSKRTVETQISKAIKLLRVRLMPYMTASLILWAVGFISFLY